MIKDKKAVIFDMDGTLIDSVGIWNEVDRKLIQAIGGGEVNAEFAQEQRDKMLREYSKADAPYVEYCNYLKTQYHSGLTADEIHSLRYKIAQEFLRDIIDYKPDAEKMLAFLQQKGITLVVASTTKKTNMDIYRTQNKNIMAKAPLDKTFAAVYTREDAKEIKPNPEIYLKVAKDFCLLPKDCLVFEDSLIGVEAAKNAGMECAVIYDKYSDHERQAISQLADYEFDNYSQVLTEMQSEF